MAKVSNSDLSAASPEKISTSLVGQLHLLGTPNLNKVFEDELCTVYVHDLEFNGERKLVVHVDVVKESNHKTMQHYYEVIEGLFDALRERGIKEVEAWVSEDHEIDFAQFYGFDQFLGELLVNDRELLPPVFMLKKEL